MMILMKIKREEIDCFVFTNKPVIHTSKIC